MKKKIKEILGIILDWLVVIIMIAVFVTAAILPRYLLYESINSGKEVPFWVIFLLN